MGRSSSVARPSALPTERVGFEGKAYRSKMRGTWKPDEKRLRRPPARHGHRARTRRREL